MVVVAFFVTLFLFIDFVPCFLEKNTAVALLNKLDVKDVQSVEILVGICHSHCQTLPLDCQIKATQYQCTNMWSEKETV